MRRLSAVTRKPWSVGDKSPLHSKPLKTCNRLFTSTTDAVNVREDETHCAKLDLLLGTRGFGRPRGSFAPVAFIQPLIWRARTHSLAEFVHIDARKHPRCVCSCNRDEHDALLDCGSTDFAAFSASSATLGERIAVEKSLLHSKPPFWVNECYRLV